jgi:anaerobic selenocysteine-containing dehydrogenase
MTIHHRTCHLCEAMCGVSVELEGERIVEIRGDANDPFSQGHICPKALGLKDVHEDPDRLKLPQRRVGDRWETIGWDDAFEEAGRRLHEIQTLHGRSAVATYLGNPTVHNYTSQIFGVGFLGTLGTRSRFSATSVDQLPQMLASLLMYGHQLLLPIPDLDRAGHLLIFGANPLVSNGSLMSAPDVRRRLKAIQQRGGKVVVIDPRRSETAQLADAHHFIKPGSDALLLLSMLQVVFETQRVRLGRLEGFTDGVEKLRSVVAPFTPEVVASATGLDGVSIRALAAEFADAPVACCYGRVGISTQEFGALCGWLINALNVVTGNVDRAGGVMFTRPAIDLVEAGARIGMKGHFGRSRTRVRGLPEFGGEYPSATMAEEMETEGPGQIRALVTHAGNPVLSTPNGRRLEAALSKLDFMVSIDIYRNETTRHANLILPPTFGLEHDHYDLVFNLLTVRKVAKWSPAALQRAPGALHDWEIFLGLSQQLEAQRGTRANLKNRAKEAVFRALGPEGVLELGLRAGPYGSWVGKGLGMKSLRDAPHGIDLGPLTPCFPDRLFTKSRKIELVPSPYLADLERLRGVLTRLPSVGQLSLIGRRELRSNNSWMHNSERLVKGSRRCTLLMNPADAGQRDLRDAQKVRVVSRVGAVDAVLQISEEMAPGVVSLPHGWGHTREGTGLRVASAHAGVSANDLCDDALVDPFCGNAQFSDLKVEVSASPKVD